jgi:hypothetical protein
MQLIKVTLLVLFVGLVTAKSSTNKFGGDWKICNDYSGAFNISSWWASNITVGDFISINLDGVLSKDMEI